MVYGEIGLLNISKEEDVLVINVMVDINEKEMEKSDINSMKLMNSLLNKLATNYPKIIHKDWDFDTVYSPEEENKNYFLTFDYLCDIKGTLAKQMNDLTKMIIKTQHELETEMIANIKKSR